MPHASLNSPFGSFTVFEADGALVALEWGRAPAGDVTPLLGQAIEQLEAYFDGRLRDFPSCRYDRAERPSNGTSGPGFAKSPTARRSYRSLALDLATSPRALAGACASNPLPIIIPVIGGERRRRPRRLLRRRRRRHQAGVAPPRRCSVDRPPASSIVAGPTSMLAGD